MHFISSEINHHFHNPAYEKMALRCVKQPIIKFKIWVNSLHWVKQEGKNLHDVAVIFGEYSKQFDFQCAVDNITSIHDTFLFCCNLRLCTSAISLCLKCQWNHNAIEYNEVYI